MKTNETRKLAQWTMLIAGMIGAAALLPAASGDEIEEQTDPPPEQCTAVPTNVIERQVTTIASIRDGSIAMERCGRFVIGFEDHYDTPANSLQQHVRFLRFDETCATQPYGDDVDGTPLSRNALVGCPINTAADSSGVSVAIGLGSASVSPPIYATFISVIAGPVIHEVPWHLAKGWTFDQASPPTTVGVPACEGPGDTGWNSSGISDGVAPASPVRTSAWSRRGSIPFAELGLVAPGLVAEKPTPTTLRACDPACFVDRWAPCISTRFTGESVICWAEPELPDQISSPMNVFIAEYTSSGTLIPSTATQSGFLVNAVDPPFSNLSQESPAAAMIGDKIVVTWVGPDPNPVCTNNSRIYAKLMTWNGTTGVPTTQKEDFIVDTDQFGAIDASVSPNPTVAITLTTQPGEGAGRFIIAWNAKRTRFVGGSPVTTHEIHAQYFDPNGDRIGGEFRLNAANGAPGWRQLAPSGRHTLVYGVQGQVVAVWNAGQSNDEQGVYYTYLPPGFETQVPTTCSAGNVDGDTNGLVDGNDIQPFVNYFLGGIPTGLSEGERDRIECAMDCDKDRDIDYCDISVFVWLLLGLPTTGEYSLDCNENCTADYIDVAKAVFPSGSCTPSLPCPCVGGDCCLCALVPTAPGPRYVMPDCNENEIDDATDIANETSADCNSDGVPDECQLAWNDCNSNGVLDVCDVNPGDPDGNESVSPDCNSNGLPDECDMAAVYFPSYDCNTNGIPDECDIAEETSVDCNTNGIPDECDIAANLKLDENENGVPDECEQEMMMMGGGGGESDGPPSSSYDNPAWETFWQWQSDNAATLAAMSRWDRYKATVDKLQELGLPAAIPWAKVAELSP